MADKPTEQQQQEQEQDHDRDVLEDLDMEQHEAEYVKGGQATIKRLGGGDDMPTES